MSRQMAFANFPKEKKEIKLMVKLGSADVSALEKSMIEFGETNKSAFIRRLIHDTYRREAKGK